MRSPEQLGRFMHTIKPFEKWMCMKGNLATPAQQDAFVKVEIACTRRVRSPAMRPVTEACLLAVRGAGGFFVTSCQRGRASQPSVCSSALAASAWIRHRTPAPPSSAKHRKHCAAKSDSLARRMGSDSALAAQYVAGANRLANWRPSPPNTTGSVATTRAWSASCNEVPPLGPARPPQTASS